MALGLAAVAASGCQPSPADNSPVDQRAEIRQILHMPAMALALEARRDTAWKRRDLNYERVYFQGRYRDQIPALLCYSDLAHSRPLPAVLIMPGSTRDKEAVWRPRDLLGLWADAGFWAMSIDRPYEGEREGDLGQAVAQKGLAAVWGEYLYDLQRALSYLESRPEVDTGRLGMLGLSMGGWEAMALAAVDTRVKVVVIAGGQFVWDELWRGGRWRRIFPGLPLARRLQSIGADDAAARQAFEAAMPGIGRVDALALAPLAAAKPMLLLVGAEDAVTGVAAARRTYERARARYADSTAVERLRLHIEPGVGHSFPPSMQAVALEWFRRWL